jgi:prefoldin subunit 5
MSRKKLKILKLLKLRSKKDLSEHARAMSLLNVRIEELEALKTSLTKQLEYYSERKSISSVSHLRSNGVFTQKLVEEIERIERQSEHLTTEVERCATELMRLDAKKQKIEDKIVFEQRKLIA